MKSYDRDQIAGKWKTQDVDTKVNQPVLNS